MEEKHSDTGVHEHHVSHEHEKKEVQHENKSKPIKKITVWQTAAAVLGILLIISLFTGGFGTKSGTKTATGTELTIQEAADKAITYINTNLLQPGTTAKLVSSEEKNGLYNIKMDIGGREFDTYLTKDGSLLFPSTVNLTQKVDTTTEPTATETPPAVEKADKPKVELFVMSYCPYGTQAEKGIIPVAELLGTKMDFSIKFVNYAMHGEKEVLENLNQYCIQAEQNTKYLPYLKCFLQAGDGSSCLTQAGIDKTKLKACTDKTDTTYKINDNLKNPTGQFPAFLINDAENKQYGVRGSPTLVINGNQASTSRSPAAFLAAICNGFNEPPAECEQTLDSANPSPGFGYAAGTAAAAAAQCG